ncbi:hypothetical protein Tco_0593502 [Tanacetum coccineum]
MNPVAAQQVALDNALVAPEKRLKIEKCNARIKFSKPQRETTYQVTLDVLKLSPSYPAFLITTEICPRLPNQDFGGPPSDEEMVHLSRNSGTLESEICYLRSILIKCTSPGEHLLLSSIGASMGSPQVLIGSGRQELKSYGECSIRRMLTFLLGTLKYVSKTEDYHKYGALIPEQMINQAIKDSKEYKIYLAYATRAATPKKSRKFKKITSPSKKQTLVLEEEPAKKHKRAKHPEPATKSSPAKEYVSYKNPSRKKTTGVQIKDTPNVSVSKKKAPATIDRSKGIDLLSEAALLEDAQLKKDLKRSKRDTTIHQEGGSSKGADSKSEVFDEPKGKSIDTSKGTSLKPRVPNVSTANSSKSENEYWGDSGDEANEQEEETQDDEYVYTPEDYVPTDDESDDVTEEEYERINEELYGNQVKDDAQATQKTKVQIPSSSILSDYAAKYLNFDNILPVDTEVVSKLDINVQHEVPRTSPLLTIPVSVIPEQTIFNPPKIVIIASSKTISSLMSSLFPHHQQLTPIPTPTITEATTSTTAVPDSEALVAFHQRITNLEKDVKELKTVNHSATLLSTIKSEVPNAIKEYLRTSLDEALYKVLKKHDADIIKEDFVPAKIVERLRQQYSFNISPKQRALYHALIESILEDEDAMDEGVADKLKKRKPDDADKDEGPFAGSD